MGVTGERIDSIRTNHSFDFEQATLREILDVIHHERIDPKDVLISTHAGMSRVEVRRS